MGKLKNGFRIIIKVIKWLFLFVVLLFSASALYNTTLSSSSVLTEKLTDPQKTYIAEYFNLQQNVLNDIWPEFGQTKIPVIVYNEEYAFLVGLENPEAGWLKVPYETSLGSEWIKIEDDDFYGETYYYQYLPDPAITPQSFTVKVGAIWAGTLQTREFAEVSFYNGFKNELPPVINQIFPYKIFWNLMMGEAENYVAGLIHEAFHAYQGSTSYDKFSQAEFYAGKSNEYPWDLEPNRTGWRKEALLLMKAYQADTDADVYQTIREFNRARDERRIKAGLTKEMIEYEKNREWLEGLAKYTELKIGMAAGEKPGYKPAGGIEHLRDFSTYKNSKKHFRNQLSEVPRAAVRSGESRFYYGGMLQAMILDRVHPDWKNTIFNNDVFLEDLLKEWASGS